VREARAAGRLVPLATLASGVVALAAVAVGVVVELLADGTLEPGWLVHLAETGTLDPVHSVEVVRAWRPVLLAATGGIAALALLGAGALRRGRWMPATIATAGSVAIVAATLGAVVDPARAAQKSVRDFADTIRARVAPEQPLVFLTGEADAEAGLPLVFYLGRHVTLRPAPGKRRDDLPAGFYVLDQQRWDRWSTPPGFTELARSPHLFSTHRRDLVLVERVGGGVAAGDVSRPAGS